MASNAAVPFWRPTGMTYITYSNICANMVRNCLKEPHKTEAISREKVHFAVSKWADGKPEKLDELLWGAAWLLKATNDATYLNLIKSLGVGDTTDIFSWDNKYAGAHFFLARSALLNNDQTFQTYRQEAEDFVCRILPSSPSSSTHHTPGCRERTKQLALGESSTCVSIQF